MTGDRSQLITAVAKTALATLFTGPLGGLKEAGTQALAVLSNSSRSKTYETILKGLRGDVESFARSERVSEALTDQALATTEMAIRTRGATVAECVDLGLDPMRVANRVVGRSAPLLRGLDEGAADLCRELLRTVYAALLAEPDALPQLDREFQRHVVNRLSELSQLPAETAASIRHLAIAALVVDPRSTWRPDLHPETALIRAEFGIVPFHGREAVLDEFTSWCAQGPTTALRRYIGAGGMGKTRLMIEACSRMRAQGWRAGFLNSGVDMPGGVLEAADPTLVVIDYGELQRWQLRGLIGQALSRSADSRTRLVVLARAQGTWWQDLASTGGGVGDFLVGPATSTEQLWPLAGTPQERRETFERATTSFAARLDRPVPVAEHTDLSGEHYDRVLFLHLAALASVLGDDVDDPRGLLDFALRRERGFWDAGVDAAGFGQLRGRPVAEAAAVATLAGRLDDRDDAIRLISNAPLLAGQPAAAVSAVADLLHGLYPGSGWLEGVQPDLLGEHLLFRVGQENPAILRIFDAAR